MPYPYHHRGSGLLAANRSVMSPIETYAKVVLHSGCALVPGKPHKWEQCPAQDIYLKRARKHQHKLKSNGLVIGNWIKEDDIQALKIKDGETVDPDRRVTWNVAIDQVLKVIKNDNS